jgi:hypothetical protein
VGGSDCCVLKHKVPLGADACWWVVVQTGKAAHLLQHLLHCWLQLLPAPVQGCLPGCSSCCQGGSRQFRKLCLTVEEWAVKPACMSTGQVSGLWPWASPGHVSNRQPWAGSYGDGMGCSAALYQGGSCQCSKLSLTYLVGSSCSQGA